MFSLSKDKAKEVHEDPPIQDAPPVVPGQNEKTDPQAAVNQVLTPPSSSGQVEQLSKLDESDIHVMPKKFSHSKNVGKKKPKLLVIWVIVIIVIGGAVGVAAYIFTTSPEAEPEPVPDPEPVPEPAPSHHVHQHSDPVYHQDFHLQRYLHRRD